MKLASLATGVLVIAALLAPGQASAAEGEYTFIETLGSANQASLTEPKGLAVDQGSGEVYAIAGRDEVQKITVSATTGNFKLRFGTETAELPYNASAGQVRDALRSVVCGGAECLGVPSGEGDAAGSKPYVVFFGRTLFTTEVPQIECEDGSPPLSGGSGCAATTTTNGVNGTISRWHPDGTPAEFLALGSNAIDGRGPGLDQTPQNALAPLNGLTFFGNLNQVAIDDSGTATDGDIYVTQAFNPFVDVFSPSGEYLGQLTEFKEGPGAEGPLKPLSLPTGVGVDPGGDVYLAEENASLINKYDPAADPVANGDNVANFTLTSALQLAAGAGPSAGYFFATQFSGELFKLDASTGALQYGGKPIARPVETEPGVFETVPVKATTLTVDPVTGYLYVAQNSEVLVFDASGPSEATLIESIPAASNVTGIAVDGSAERLYVARKGSEKIDVYAVLVLPEATTEAATQVLKSTATLNGTLNPEGVPVTECRFEYGETKSYGQSAPCEVLDGNPISGPGEIPADEQSHSVSADLSGLDPNTIYHYRLVVGNATAADKGEDETFMTLGPPLIEAESVTAVTATEATIEAEVDPRGEESEAAVEYVSEAKFNESGYAEASVSEAEEIGEGIGFVEFSQLLTSLKPDTTYHFRILAQNQVDPPVHGEDKTLITLPIDTGLADNRAYELVSPAQKMGEVWTPEPGPRPGLGGSCKVCTPGWSAPKAPMQSSPDGDAIAYQGDPFTTGLAAEANSYVSRRPEEGGWQTSALSTPQLEAQVFKGFSPDLSKAIMEQADPALSPEAPPGFADLYLREEGKGLTALITSEPPQRSPGTEGSNPFEVTYAGANEGTESVEPFTHVLLQANDALTEEVSGIAPEAPEVDKDETDLYEWSGGELHLVNVLPGNTQAAPDAVIGSGRLLDKGATNFNFDHAISDDGSRIFWSVKSSGQVYVREGAESTIRIPDPGKFITATPDGSKVLLSDGVIYGLEDESTTDLSEGQGGFQGIAGASEDLSRVYFVDTEALTPEA